MEREPERPEPDQAQEPVEAPPPFQPDPALFANQDRGGEPTEQEVLRVSDRAGR
jgi:hypothetical protein